ncbi:hypothetical protein P5V15_005379 [Pogonomyrmex californicus]
MNFSRILAGNVKSIDKSKFNFATLVSRNTPLRATHFEVHPTHPCGDPTLRIVKRRLFTKLCELLRIEKVIWPIIMHQYIDWTRDKIIRSFFFFNPHSNLAL